MTARLAGAAAVALVACRAPASRPPERAPEPAKVVPPAADASAPPEILPRPLGTHEIVWSKSGQRLAAHVLSTCGPPGEGEQKCDETGQISAVDVRPNGAARRRADGDIFGFRTDDEWLVIRDRERATLEEWSLRTDAVRPSAFAARTNGATGVCLSPDDDHLVVVLGASGGTFVRARTSTDETRLDEHTFSALPPRDCAFAPDGKSFAVAGEQYVAVYRLGQPHTDVSFHVPNATHLAWSQDGAALTFGVVDAGGDAPRWVFYVWNPNQLRAVAYATSVPAVLHPRRPELILRSGCEWAHQRTTDGKHLGAIGPTAEVCFHVQAHDAVLSPTGRMVAALAGAWGSKELQLLPLP